MPRAYKVVRETHQGLDTWAIRVLINGMVQDGTMGAGYETEAEANYCATQLAYHDMLRGR